MKKGQALSDRITANPAVMVGKPVVRGTRIPVELILNHLADNPDLGDLFEAYPQLTLDDVRACLEYAAKLVEANNNLAIPGARRKM